MGKETFFDKIRELISSLAFRVFLWANRLTQEEYFKQIESEKIKRISIAIVHHAKMLD